MMIILQARAKGCRYRLPLANVHGVVLFIVIPPVAKFSRVGPIVLHHIYPRCKNAYANPHHQRKLQIASQLPQKIKAKGLRKNCENWVGGDAKSPGLQNLVASQIFPALIGH